MLIENVGNWNVCGWGDTRRGQQQERGEESGAHGATGELYLLEVGRKGQQRGLRPERGHGNGSPARKPPYL